MFRLSASGFVLVFVILLSLLVVPASAFVSSGTARGAQFKTLLVSPSSQREFKMGLDPIKVTKNPTEEQIAALGARDWPTWGCGVSKFPWTYEGTETCLILEGDVTVTPDDDREPVTVGVGDICVFPDGMKCTWDVRAPIKKHYKFE